MVIRNLFVGLTKGQAFRRRFLRCLAIILVALPAITAFAAHELDNRDGASGETLYAENCASCHGADLEGQPDWRSPDENGVFPAPPHDETGHTWHHGNELLFKYTKFGGEEALARQGVVGFKSGMPGFSETLSDGQIWEILAYIRSTWPQQIQENHSLRNPPHN